MPDSYDAHDDAAAYTLGTLSPEERATFEQHLEGCERCRLEVVELRPTVRLLRRAAPAEVPSPGLRDRVLRAVDQSSRSPAASSSDSASAPAPTVERQAVRVAHHPRASGPRHGGRRRRATIWATRAVATVAAVGVGVFGGIRLADERRLGRLELETALQAPGTATATATARVTQVEIGRIVRLETDALPVLDNDREFYELWFLRPNDRPGSPERVSAGTFHPDEQGRTSVELTAAVVPQRYPILSVTREPRDGDPRPSRVEVLRSTPG